MDRVYKVADAAVVSYITNKLLAAEDVWQFKKDDNGFVEFVSEAPFQLSDMSYHMRLALGFYYGNFPMLSVKDDYRDVFIVKAKGIGYSMLTPMWYILSNLGSPNSVSKQDNPWYCSNAAIAMRIQNSFVNEQPLSFSNSEFITTSQASSLSNIRCMVVDSNLEPIKFLNPISITISVKDIPPDEDKEAQFLEQASNKELKRQILEKQHSNAIRQTAQLVKLSHPENQWNVPSYGPMFKDDKSLATETEKKATEKDKEVMPEEEVEPAPQPEEPAQSSQPNE
jgi:hypothetical protein